MKKTLLTLVVAGMTLSASAQDKGRFEVYDLGNFKLHVYYTNDALGDASYIIEGRKALVTMNSRCSRTMWRSSTPISPNWGRRSGNASPTTM